MPKHETRKRKIPAKYDGFESDYFSSKKIEKKSTKKRKLNTDDNSKRHLSFFSDRSSREKREIEDGESSSVALLKSSAANKLMQKLGLDNTPADTYIPSSIDKPHLVSVHYVNLLKNINGRGLFATEDIPQGTCLGIYTGEEYSREEFETHLEENSETDKSYAMYIGDKVVDAFAKGNFTRYINFSDSQANVEFKEAHLNYKKVVKVMAVKDIKKGQQILVDYNTYDERASKLFYFLNPQDGWQSTTELYNEYSKKYQLMKIPANIPQFHLKKNDNLFVTTVGKMVLENKALSNAHKKYEAEEINLPYLKKEGKKTIVDFIKMDAFTPLMLACYLGHVENVRWLIQNKANINQQQNHSGNCPLFFALEGYSSTKSNKASFIKIIKLLISNQANLKVHDRADKTFLHKAIAILPKKYFAAIIKFIKEQEHIEFSDLFSYLDENSDDIILFCLREKYFDEARILLANYPDYFKRYYMSGDKAYRAFNKDAFITATQDYSSSDREILSDILKESALKINPKLFLELGFQEQDDSEENQEENQTDEESSNMQCS